VGNLQSDNADSVVEFTPAQLVATGSMSPAVFLDSNIFGLNIHQPALLTFGPIPQDHKGGMYRSIVQRASLRGPTDHGRLQSDREQLDRRDQKDVAKETSQCRLAEGLVKLARIA
jgi:hypothetical protein